MAETNANAKREGSVSQEKKSVIKIGPQGDIAEAVLVAGVFVLILFFTGEPDLMDAIIRRLMTIP